MDDEILEGERELVFDLENIVAWPVISLGDGRGCWGCRADHYHTETCQRDMPGCHSEDRFRDPADPRIPSPVFDQFRGRVVDVIFPEPALIKDQL